MTQPAAAPASGDVVARVEFQYRWRSWAFAIFLLGIGIYSLHDGFVVYPRENAAWREMGNRVDRPPKQPHDTPGVLFNQLVGVVCTAVSVPFLIWREYRSRGEYRLSGDKLQVPGHGPISLTQVRGLDLVRWDKKGIAIVEYESPAAAGAYTLTLNDMIYQREPTDKIVERIEAHLNALDANDRPEVPHANG